MNEKTELRVPAIRFRQPLGEFCVASLSAEFLLEVCYSDPFRLEGFSNEAGYELSGSQRELRDIRLSDIGRFIDTVDAAFPNSIILAANYRDDGQLETEDRVRWRFETDGHPDLGWLTIPTRAKLAAIVDGQRRLFGFEKSQVESRKDMPLVCSVYLDLPHSFQAYLFATINYNQKPVDKSQTYELYAIDLESSGPETWTPEKAAVFLCRKLNIDSESPFRGHIVVAALSDESLAEWVAKQRTHWAVSTACVVEGLLRLISSNPKRDRDEMHRFPIGRRHRKVLANLASERSDGPPLRKLFLEVNDLAIFTLTRNYFRAVAKVLWKDDAESYLQKTVGIQALFDVFRSIVRESLEKRTIKEEFFLEKLKPCAIVDFMDSFFQQASGTGRQRIRNCLELCLGIRTLDEIKSDQEQYRRLCQL